MNEAKRLSGTVALVTGASSGIGEAAARLLSREGAAALGLMYTAKAAVPHLLEAAEGERGVADMINISSVAGRIARRGSGVYNATKFGVGAFSESLRQEVTRHHVRVSLVEPGAVATELQSHNRPGVKEEIEKRFEDMAILQAEDIADAIGYVVTRPRHVAVNEILVRPTEQEA